MSNAALVLLGGVAIGYFFNHHIHKMVGPVLGAPFGQVKKDMRMPIGSQQHAIMENTMAARTAMAQQAMMPH